MPKQPQGWTRMQDVSYHMPETQDSPSPNLWKSKEKHDRKCDHEECVCPKRRGIQKIAVQPRIAKTPLKVINKSPKQYDSHARTYLQRPYDDTLARDGLDEMSANCRSPPRQRYIVNVVWKLSRWGFRCCHIGVKFKFGRAVASERRHKY